MDDYLPTDDQVTTPNLTTRTICGVGFASGSNDKIANYVANVQHGANNDTNTTNEDDDGRRCPRACSPTTLCDPMATR